MEILSDEQSLQIRNSFIYSFIDTSSERYRISIQNIRKFKDGLCYTGYLWECFDIFELTTEVSCMDFIKNKSKFYVMWDIHSCDKILIPDYWKYPKNSVLSISFEEFIEKYNTFPEDIYFFDDEYTWCFAFTHEEDMFGNRYCLSARQRGANEITG